MIFIASDHGGFNLKKVLIKHFADKNVDYVDLGPEELVPTDDYPEYVLKLVQEVRKSTNNYGILICRNGVGVNMFANKFRGIRAALSFGPRHAASTKLDDNANVLTLPADYLEEDFAKEIVDSWFSTNFSNKDRHIRRLQELEPYGQP